MTYDSTAETIKHSEEVNALIKLFAVELALRGESHDMSKLESPEKEIFDKATPMLKELTYGSEEYKKQLKDMQPALDHHYANNRHHPEHHKDGIKGMNLGDIVEMFCDWWAASKRHADGDIRKSIEINQKRFGYSDDLKQIFLNTIGEQNV